MIQSDNPNLVLLGIFAQTILSFVICSLLSLVIRAEQGEKPGWGDVGEEGAGVTKSSNRNKRTLLTQQCS